MENKNKISKQKKTNLSEPDANQESNIAQKTSVIVVSTALNAEGRDTHVFGGGEIFHTIFSSSSRTRNIWYGKMLTHLFMENAYIYSFHQFCIPFYLFVGLKLAKSLFRPKVWEVHPSFPNCLPIQNTWYTGTVPSRTKPPRPNSLKESLFQPNENAKKRHLSGGSVDASINNCMRRSPICLAACALLTLSVTLSAKLTIRYTSTQTPSTCSESSFRSFVASNFYRPELRNDAYGTRDNAFLFTNDTVCDEKRCWDDWPSSTSFQEQFRTAVKPVPSTLLPRPQRGCASCALVGGSARLLAQNLGGQIDSHTHVIRMNKAPTAGFEPSVGSRTSFRVCTVGCTADMFEWPTELDVTYIFYFLRASRDLQWMKTAKSHAIDFAVLSPAWMKTAKQLFELSKRPSTGTLALVWALNSGICHSVDIFGFSGSLSPSLRRRFDYHYYEKSTVAEGLNRMSDFHDPIEVEGAVQKYLVDMGVIRIF